MALALGTFSIESFIPISEINLRCPYLSRMYGSLHFIKIGNILCCERELFLVTQITQFSDAKTSSSSVIHSAEG